MEEILSNLGKMIHEFDESHFGIYVATGPQQGGNNSPERRIGRVVQVRKEAGDYGSDIVFLRHWTGELWTHTNQAFFKVRDEYTEILNKKFEDILNDPTMDKPNTPYTMADGHKKKGFIIPSPIKEGESTPLRDIRNKLKQKIGEL